MGECLHLVFGIHVSNRVKEASCVQGLLTEYGCNIRTRIGLHQVAEGVCATGGLIILEMFGSPDECQELACKLAAIEGVCVKQMCFPCE
jgi:hypothetical protein